MTLLGMAARRPVEKLVYYMPRDLYDRTDHWDHPILVVAIDEVRHQALVVTRTSRFEARGPKPVSHPADVALGLDLPGWWRLHRLHRVEWPSFNDPDVRVRGPLDDSTWERVVEVLSGTEGKA